VREHVAHEQHVEDIHLQGAARRHQRLQRGEQARRGRLRQRLLGQDIRRPPGNTTPSARRPTSSVPARASC